MRSDELAESGVFHVGDIRECPGDLALAGVVEPIDDALPCNLAVFC